MRGVLALRPFLLTLALATGAVASALPAQQVQQRFATWEALPVSADRDSVSPSGGDYRIEGLVFGGLVLGGFGAWLGSRPYSGACPLEPGVPCGRNDDRLEGGVILGLLGAAVGGGLGYLVGRFSPKRPRPEQFSVQPAPVAGVPDSIRIRSGYQHWRGAGLGLLIGSGVGAVAGAVLSTIGDGCSDCTSDTSAGEGALILGLLGAGSGSVVGFLAGLASPRYAWVQRSALAE